MKTFFLCIFVAIIAVGGYMAYEGGNFGGAFESDVITDIAGSITNAVSIPASAVFANSTTTDAASTLLADAGFEVNQVVNTNGVRDVMLFGGVKGGTATSTLYILQMGSYDGENYYHVTTSTAGVLIATTTLSEIRTAVQWDPGTATTTFSKVFNTYGHRFTRFIIWGDNLSTDPNDGVQVYMDAEVIKDIAR